MPDFYTIGKNDISDLYSRIRSENRRELDRRREKILAELPELEGLERELSELNTGLMRKVVTNPAGDFKALKQQRKEEAHLIETRMEELLRTKGYSLSDLKMSYNCPICRDEGVVDGQRCSCYKKHMLELLYHQSSLGDILQRENFDTFSLDWYSDRVEEDGLPSSRKNMEKILRKVKDFTEHPETRKSFLFYGESGVGKTFLSNCMAKALMDQGHTVLYLTANELFQQILSPYLMSPDAETRSALQPVFSLIYNADLLILDDLGTELTNSFTLSQLFEIVNRRNLDSLSTVISTNLSLNQLKDRYQDRIVFRIIERYELCRIYGQNIRTGKGQKKYS